MTQQLDTNADASTDASASVTDASTDVSASTDADAAIAAAIAAADADASAEDAQEMLAASIADDITKVFDSALPQLLAIRDSTYANAIEALDSEADALAKEYEQLEDRIHDIEAMLPARERVTQRAVDELLLSGAKQGAANKLAELKVFKSESGVMRERMSQIHDRFQSIDREKQGIAKQVFAEWYGSVVRPTIRAAEHGLFITLLSGVEQSLYSFRDSTGVKIHQGHIIGLTADEKSQEWKAARHWYGM